MAEMRRIVESPEKCDLRDAFLAGSWIAQVFPAALQSLGANPIRDRRTASRKQSVQMADRNSHRGGDLRGAKRRFRQMVLNVIQDARDWFFPSTVFANSCPRTPQAGRQYLQIGLDGRGAFFRGQRSRLLIERGREMEKRSTQSAGAGYPCRVGNQDIPESAFHQESWHSKIQPCAISGAVGGPGKA